MDTLLTTDTTTRLWLLLHSCGLELLILMLKASVLLIICLWCISQLQRSSAEIRHLSWLCFFLSLALLPTVGQLLPNFEFSISSYPAISIHEQLQQLVSQSASNADLDKHYPISLMGNIDSASQLNRFGADIDTANYQFSGIAIFAMLYSIIVAIKLCRFIYALFQLRGLTQRSTYAFELTTINNIDCQKNPPARLKTLLRKCLSRRIKVYTSHEISSAITWKSLQPCILLPCQFYSWDEQTIKSVIAHELAHIKRNDWLSLSFAKLVAIIFFPVPFLHRAFLQTSLEAESSADNQVLSQGQTTIDYAQSLLQLAKGASRPNTKTTTAINTHKHIAKIIAANEFALSYAVGITGSSELGTRINRIIEPIAIRTPIHRSHKLSSLFFTVCFVTPLAVIQPATSIFQSNNMSIPVAFASEDFPNDKSSIKNPLTKTEKPSTAEQQLNSIADLVHHTRLITPPNINQYKEQALEFNQVGQAIELHSITEPQASFYKAAYDIKLPSRTAIATISNETNPSQANPQKAVALHNVVPKYPKRALRKNIEGEVHAIYSVDSNGQATDIIIVSSKPKSIFDKAVITAIKRSRFIPSESAAENNIAIDKPPASIEKVLFEQSYFFRLSDKNPKFAQRHLDANFTSALEPLSTQTSTYASTQAASRQAQPPSKQSFGVHSINSS